MSPDARPPRGSDDVAMTVRFAWLRRGEVQLGPDRRLMFPDLPAVPGLYRFRLVSDAQPSIYIGEADDLRRRLAHYRNPGPTQRTNIRMNARMVEHVAAGGRIEVHVATDAWLVVDDAEQRLDLARRASRLFAENAALVAAALEGAAMIENL